MDTSNLLLVPLVFMLLVIVSSTGRYSNMWPTRPKESGVRFEGGYMVKTVFDSSNTDMEPFAVQEVSGGDLLVLDSAGSRIHKVAFPLSPNSKFELVAGSKKGYAGHVDGKPSKATMNHPTGLAVDGTGNVYVADVMNNAIRKISKTGVTTIVGGQLGGKGGVKLSRDFDITFVQRSSSLLVVDRGNKAIREIKLKPGDCSQQSDLKFQLVTWSIAAAAAAGFLIFLITQPTSGDKSTPPIDDPRPRSKMMNSAKPNGGDTQNPFLGQKKPRECLSQNSRETLSHNRCLEKQKPLETQNQRLDKKNQTLEKNPSEKQNPREKHSLHTEKRQHLENQKPHTETQKLSPAYKTMKIEAALPLLLSGDGNLKYEDEGTLSSIASLFTLIGISFIEIMKIPFVKDELPCKAHLKDPRKNGEET